MKIHALRCELHARHGSSKFKIARDISETLCVDGVRGGVDRMPEVDEEPRSKDRQEAETVVLGFLVVQELGTNGAMKPEIQNI